MKDMFDKQFADLPKEYQKDIPSLDSVYRLEQTPDCPSGTRGRIGTFEMFDMNIELERAILANKPEDELFSIVRKSGMLTMKEDAIIKAAQGITPFEEVNTLGGEFELTDIDEIVPPPPVEIGEDATVKEPNKDSAQSGEVKVDRK